MPTPTFNKLGYPTDETLNVIEFWKFPFDGLWDFIKEAWNTQYGQIKESKNLLKFSTGGWSGNEDIIAAMQNNTAFWSMYWKASVRGGIEIFREVKSNTL